MWAAHGEMFILGGRSYQHDSITGRSKAYTINNFHIYHIEAKTWRSVEFTSDPPFNISEFTVLPLYDFQDTSGFVDCKRNSVIIWGGFNERDELVLNSEEAMVAMHGEHVDEFRTAYCKRLLQYGLDPKFGRC